MTIATGALAGSGAVLAGSASRSAATVNSSNGFPVGGHVALGALGAAERVAGAPALSRTVGTRVSSSSATVTSGSMVIPDNSLVVLITKTMRDTSDVSPLTITNSGTAATWTQQVVTPSQSDQYSQRIWFHTAYFTTGGTFTFTATAASAPPGGFAALTLLPIVYQNASTTLGVSGSANNGPTDGAWTPSLSGAPAATSDVLAAITATIAGSGNIYQTDGSGVTRLDTANLAGGYGGSVSVRTGSTTASYTWDDVLAPSSTDTIYLNSIYAALEVKQAAAGPATHATSGALTGQIGSISGTAARLRAFSTSGVLTGQGSTIAGSAARGNGATTHDTSGALTGSGSTIAGTAVHNTVRPTSGVLIGQGSVISGTAARTGAAVTHSTSGALVGSGSLINGSAFIGQILQDTHDGYWHKQWEKLHKKKPKLEEVIELVKEEPEIALEEVKEAVKREYPQIDYTQIAQNAELQLYVAKQILIALELRRIADDEDDIEILMLI